MQDIQNIPPPNATPLDIEDNFGSHSDYPNIEAQQDIDAPRDNSDTDVESIPVPPDRQDESTPIEEPPTTDVEGIDEDSDNPQQIV